MAEEMGITLRALNRWTRRCDRQRTAARAGRPEVIPAAARWKLRACYLEHYKQWGPQVLREWSRRTGLGEWSATTITGVIADLRDAPEDKPQPIRYEITGSNVMWSEDGTGFKERGRKKELVVAQDEHARFKVGYELVDGPADEESVHANLEAAFARYGTPLVLKHDGGSIFHGRRIQALLREHGVIELTGPRHYPQYNGKKERSMRDIKSYVRGMRRHGKRSTLKRRIDSAVHDLNHDRPRPVLAGCTAHEVFQQDRLRLPDRREFAKTVDRTERQLREAATSRAEKDAARRRAIEQVLFDYGLMKEIGDVSHNFKVAEGTN
jgi:transposase InsO family protein